MTDGALPDIGDNLHVHVGMRSETGIRRDDVVVPDTHDAPAGGWVREREMMLGLEPAVVAGKQGGKGSAIDHGATP